MKTKRLLFNLFLFGAFVALPGALLAQNTGYTLLEPLPLGEGGGLVSEVPIGSLSDYLSQIFRLTIVFASALAVFQLIRGGFMYITSASFGTKNDAKKIIQETMLGLALVLGSWVIVATIFAGNDKIVSGGFLNFDFNIPAIPAKPNENPPAGTAGAGGVRPGYPLTPQQVEQNTNILIDLENHNPPVTVNNDGRPCTTGGTIGCTNVVGLPSSAINGVKNLATACGCSVQITGGTEGGHSNHGFNMAAVDLSPTSELNAYLAKTNPVAANPTNGTRVRIPGGGTYTYETTGANGRATGNHWHVQY